MNNISLGFTFMPFNLGFDAYHSLSGCEMGIVFGPFELFVGW